jgi:hypothetical protein
MGRTKLLVSTFALGLVFVLTGTMSAQNSKTSFDGGIGWYNGCANDGSIVNAPGSTEVNYQQNNTQATVHVVFHNSTMDGSYKLNLEANQSYTAVAATYDLPFHSIWVGQGGNFTMDGTLRIAVDANGTPTSSNILMDDDHPVTTACTQISPS